MSWTRLETRTPIHFILSRLKKHPTKYLNKLHMYSITTITITQIRTQPPNISYPHKNSNQIQNLPKTKHISLTTT